MASKTKYDLTKETDQGRFIERVFEFFDDEGFDAQRVACHESTANLIN